MPGFAGALGMLVAAALATILVVSWIWTKTDELTPVSLPSAKGTPLETLDPSAKPTIPPDPEGKYVGSFMVAWNNDKMAGMSSAWKADFNRISLYGGTGLWLTVHTKYNGKSDWGNYVAFGGLPKNIVYKPTPAGMREAAAQVGGRMVNRLYPANKKPVPTNIVHKAYMANGHRVHEITARLPVKEPGLKETYSIIAMAVIDRGDGTAMVSIADLCGSTPQWLTVWRQRIAKVIIN